MEASAAQVVSSLPAADESAPPVHKQVHQEQIAADPGCFELTQQRTVENIVHVPIPQIQEQFVEGVKEIHQERLLELIEELIENAPVPHSVEEIEEVVQIIQERVHGTRRLAVSFSVPPPVVEDVTPELESLQNVIHEKQIEVDRCVIVLKRGKEKLRLLEECSFVRPHELEELRRHIPTGKDVMAAAMRDLQACCEQPGLRLKREDDVKTAQRAELFGTSGAPSSQAQKAKKSRHQK